MDWLTYLCFNQVAKGAANFKRVTLLKVLAEFLHALVEGLVVEGVWLEHLLDEVLQLLSGQHLTFNKIITNPHCSSLSSKKQSLGSSSV
mgnify:CR=1 FL=1